MILTFERIVSSLSDIFTIFASTIAIYLFIFKSEKIAKAFNMLINFSFHLTLSELQSKIERLNEYTVNESKDNVLNILNEIEGQLIGNPVIKHEFATILKKISNYTSLKKTITEPMKRSLVSELKETLRNVDINNYRNSHKKQ